ncbi:MAG: histidine phosphatase family protein [Lachnospiraceae bacterium]|nr:histidine phosphatase family protein [Lachnospiraceae bacterium]
MKLILIRHGDPDYVHDALTEKGVREAKLLAERVAGWNVKDFYCSPLGRAQATASYSLEKLNRTAITKDWMQEFYYRVKDIHTGNERIAWDLMPCDWTKDPLLYDKDHWTTSNFMGNGILEPHYQSVCEGLDALLAEHGYCRKDNYYQAVKPNTDTIVVFCHLGVICVMLSHLLGIAPSPLWQGIFLAPTSVTILKTEERIKGDAYFRCQVIGDTSHLLAGPEPISPAGSFIESSSGL